QEELRETPRWRTWLPLAAVAPRRQGLLLCQRRERLQQPLGIRPRTEDEEGADEVVRRQRRLSVHLPRRHHDRLPPVVRSLSAESWRQGAAAQDRHLAQWRSAYRAQGTPHPAKRQPGRVQQ